MESERGGTNPRMPSSPLRVLVEASCLTDGRRDAGIGRYARELLADLRGEPDLSLIVSTPARDSTRDMRPVRWLRAQPRALSTAMRTRPAVVHALAGEPVVGVAGARQVVTLHDVEMWRSRSGQGARARAQQVYFWTLARLLRRCAAIICPSRTSAEDAVAALGLLPTRITVIPHGVRAGFTHHPSADDEALLRAAGVDAARYVLWTGSLRTHDPR